MWSASIAQPMAARITALLTMLLIILWSGASSAGTSYNSQPCLEGPTNQRGSWYYLFYPNAFNYDHFLGVCNLEGLTSEIEYSGDATYVNLFPGMGIRSCGRQSNSQYQWGCREPVAFRVQVIDPDAATQFQLRNSAGEILPVDFTLTLEGSPPINLAPNQWSAAAPHLPGNVRLTPAALQLQIPDPTQIRPGTYEKTFQFTVEQASHTGQYYFDSGSTLAPIDFTVRLVIEPKIRISGLSDVTLTADFSDYTSSDQAFCVYSRNAEFTLRALSLQGTAESAFLLSDGADTIPYEVLAGPKDQNATLLDYNTPYGPWQGALVDGCTANGMNMSLEVRIHPTQLSDARAGIYTDTLTLVVELE
ncbi:hypothetical protein [Microbulbifer sp. HZ11]|uniref:hypothetical protein n=1 Tax=Microbulbifer sp. HZ11 TaxID=1453501 RepID=UPI0005BE308B|nr:hypothetical protein [Microbulbifer sp. HZ11]